MAEHPNIAVNMIDTGSLSVCVREPADRVTGRPLVLVHGNVSSSPFFFPLMTALAESSHTVRPLAVDLRGFGGTDTAPVDATRGLSDFADDVWATIDALGLAEVDLLGWSMGGGVVLQMLLDRPGAVRTVTLLNPVSPYGFGGTAGPDGTPVHADDPGLGTGGGTANPAFVQALSDGDVTATTPSSPLSVLRAFYVGPDWDRADEDFYVASMLSTSLGAENYPGDMRTSQHWPQLSAGDRGVLNTMSPRHFNVSRIVEVDPKPPVLWIRGEADLIVSDKSMFDLATLGALGAIPDYPGVSTWPVQPMVTQTRSVLQRYADAGGSFTEHALPGVGHSPHIERTDEVARLLLAHLG